MRLRGETDWMVDRLRWRDLGRSSGYVRIGWGRCDPREVGVGAGRGGGGASAGLGRSEVRVAVWVCAAPRYAGCVDARNEGGEMEAIMDEVKPEGEGAGAAGTA